MDSFYDIRFLHSYVLRPFAHSPIFKQSIQKEWNMIGATSLLFVTTFILLSVASATIFAPA